jgi:RND family efflux transporter MFP subunit
MGQKDQTEPIDKRADAELPRPTWMHRLVKAMPMLVVLLLVAIIVLLGGEIRSEGKLIKEKKSSEIRQDRQATNVITMEVAPQRLQEKISLPGYVKPWISLQVVAEVKGKIVTKAVSEGMHVKKGDVLASVDRRDYANAYASAKAAYEVAAATEKRQRKLFRERVTTQAQIDDIVATVRTSKAAMDNAALALERCNIKSPMDGIVDRVYVEPGQFMDVGNPVAKVLEIGRVKVEVGIPESDVDAVRRLERFSFSVEALGGKVFEGTRHYLQKTADDFARLYNLEIAVENPDFQILPDMFTRVVVVKTEVPQGLAVPLYSVVKRNDMDAVFVFENGMVRLKPVELGIQDGWNMQVRKGIKAGDQVVVVGQRSIEDGETVHVTKTVHSMEELTQ